MARLINRDDFGIYNQATLPSAKLKGSVNSVFGGDIFALLSAKQWILNEMGDLLL